MENYEDALPDLDKLIAAAPKDASLLKQRAYVNVQLGATAKALTDYNQALEINPKDASAYYSRGLLYLSANDVAKAKPDLQKVVDLNGAPNHVSDAKEKLAGL